MTDPPTPDPAPDRTAPGLRLSVADGVATLTIDNRPRMNALNAAMWGEIPARVRQADDDPAVRVICIRGAGERAFSAGADISEFDSNRSGDAADAYNALNHAAFAALQACAKPSIALIHGHCLGGGLAIAACCDLRLADEAAQFAIPAARLGIGYDPRWIAPLLRILSPAHVKEILFTGRRFDATEASAMGLVNRVLPAAGLEAAVAELAATIAGNAPLTIGAAKAAIDALSDPRHDVDMTALDDRVRACFESRDYAEGRRAFMEKRRPKFIGA